MKRAKKYKLLVIGKKPYTGKNHMGMGGVGIHVVRLTEWLDEQKVNYWFYDLSLFNLFSFVKYIFISEVGHLHSSSPYVRILFSIVCRISQTQSICTYHGDLGRFGKLKNICDNLSVRMMDYPIVLNEYSLSEALKLNSKSLLISAYIPPITKTELNPELKEKILAFCKKYKKVIATNAYAMNFDKNGEEIYGIIPLVEVVKSIPDTGIVLSDSSGDYFEYYKDLNMENVFIIKDPHPFVGVLPHADVFIRYTSTDGDSLSIHEALDIGLPVITTNVVSRPKGCTLIERGDSDALKNAIISICPKIVHNSGTVGYETVEIFKFYNDIHLLG